MTDGADLVVTVLDVASSAGIVRVAVCDRAAYPGPPYTFSADAQAVRGTTKITLPAVPAGRYAVMAYHDHDLTGRLDKNIVGIPLKGFGFSRGARARFGPPDFDRAAIETAPAASVTIRLQYWLRR